MAGRLKLKLPVIEKIEFTDFELYQKKPSSSVPVNKPVFCLIGANGLGKSTFLNAVLYALTGAIPVRSKGFLTMDEYAKEATRPRYVRDYFGGRLPEACRTRAAVSLTLRWPDGRIVLKRPIFKEGGQGGFEKRPIAPEDGKQSDKHEGFGDYKTEVARLCGLESFEHFLFLMHFVCVFDEDRHLLLWDQRALSSAIMLAFGQSLSKLEEQDALNEEIRREDSRARNAKFMATKAREQIKSIEAVLSDGDEDSSLSDAELEVQHNRLQQEVENAISHLNSKDKQLREIEGEWGTKSAALSEARLEYSTLFAERSASTPIAFHHPVIRATISEDKCAICGTHGVGKQIEVVQSSNECPLCSSSLEAPSPDENLIERLTALDQRIERLRMDLDAVIERRSRVASERESAFLARQAAQSALEEFLSERPEASWGFAEGGVSNIPKGLKELREQQDKFNEDAVNHRKQRNKLRKQLSVLETNTSRQYEEVGGVFVKRFSELAGAFIGLPIEINLSQKTGVTTGFDVDLRMNHQVRADDSTVSESQRFFLDIALRMALVEFVAFDEATLIVDTPEGSLDIAYEAKAGAMFSDFASSNNRILMTANLRSSALLEELAQLQRKEGMQLVKMTEWAELSAVQKAEEVRFERAYKDIERHLQ
ncbi:hypothetical protein KX928_01185 [Roseobacter sp. YSTF-M11]|uniref:Rad50/SbcC-type AAA domain-containing protein n=1 Tax=Roseobacter insulae TaxID=2859783 RepID=A0A9X1JYN4_9RHOB|nr:hypothetical protein [Roseobacter insulae]MBW4706394.1 hypothetical protein [Roseobacter insulae]